VWRRAHLVIALRRRGLPGRAPLGPRYDLQGGGGYRFNAVRCTRLGQDTLDVEVGREVALVASHNAYGRTVRWIFRICSIIP